MESRARDKKNVYKFTAKRNFDISVMPGTGLEGQPFSLLTEENGHCAYAMVHDHKRFRIKTNPGFGSVAKGENLYSFPLHT